MRSTHSRWQAGSTLQVFFKLSQPDRSFAYKTYKGHLVRISVVDPQAWPCSPWEALEVQWGTAEEGCVDTAGTDASRDSSPDISRISPWEVQLEKSKKSKESALESDSKAPGLPRGLQLEILRQIAAALPYSWLCGRGRSGSGY